MTKQEIRQLYYKLLDHPRLPLLADRYQEILSDLAYGMTQMDVARERKISRARAWQLRNQAIFQLGFRIFENKKLRAMTMIEIRERLSTKKHEVR